MLEVPVVEVDIRDLLGDLGEQSWACLDSIKCSLNCRSY